MILKLSFISKNYSRMDAEKQIYQQMAQGA
jgi:hypothetical protein